MRVLVKNGTWTQAAGFSEALQPYIGAGARIAVVGSGGKTSVILRLAAEQRALGKKVLVLTTTHMYKPEKYGVFSGSVGDVGAALEKDGIAIAGSEIDGGKIGWQGDAFYREAAALAVVVIIEADGSKKLPVKYPGAAEPVVPRDVSLILAVSGLGALGKSGKEACHRWERARVALGAADEAILGSEQLRDLLKKGYLLPLRERFPNVPVIPILNQADGGLAETGKKIIDALGVEAGIVSSMRTVTTGFVLMASGFGKRFGSNKLLYPLNGKPLYRYALSNLSEAAEALRDDCAVSVAVISQYREILDEAKKLGFIAVFNPESERGITSSLKLGLKNLPSSEHYVFSVADQPYFHAETMAEFVRKYLESGKTIGCVSDGEATGNPVIFSRAYLPELLSLEGDRGGKQLVTKYPEELFLYAVPREELIDLDRPEDLK